MLTYLQSNDLITQKQYVFCLKFLLGSSSIDVIYFDFCRGQRPAPIKLISLLLARQIALASTSIKLPSLWLSSIYTSDSTDVDYTQLLTTDDRRRRRTGPLLNSPIAAMDSPDLPAALSNRPVRRYKSERPYSVGIVFTLCSAAAEYTPILASSVQLKRWLEPTTSPRGNNPTDAVCRKSFADENSTDEF